MIENKVPTIERNAIYGAVRLAGGFAWEANARDRAARLVRILPSDRLNIGPDKLWPDYQRALSQDGVLEELGTQIPNSFCARADLPTNEALGIK
jgi:hypothetical protein